MTSIHLRSHLAPIQRTSERHEGRAGLIALDRNERVSPISERIFRDMLAQITVSDLMSYPDAGPFVERLARYLNISEANIAECAGSDAAIRRAFMAFLKPGRTVVSLDPSYAMYQIYTRIFQGVIKTVDVAADRSVDVNVFVDAIDLETDIVVIANPNQPTGTAVSVEKIRRIVGKAAEVGALCIVDEAYYPFHAITALPLIHEFTNLLVTRSLSKYPGCAGLRLGYAVGNPSLISGLMAVRGGNEVSALSLACGCYLLDHPEIAEGFRVAVGEGRRLLNDAAVRLGFDPLDCVTNFQLLRCGPGRNPQGLAKALEKRGYLVKAGFDHPAVKDCVRVTLNGPDIMQRFVMALKDAASDPQVSQP